MSILKRSENFLQNSLTLFGALAILPFLILSFFNHPLGIHEWDWITKMGGQLDSLSFWELQWHAYQEWTGRYASTFWSALSPYVYTLSNFKLFFFLNIIVGFGVLYFSIRELLQIKDKLTLFSLVFLVWMCFAAGVSGVYDTFYMMTGVQTYAFGGYAFLLLMALWKRYAGSKKRIKTGYMIILLSFFAAGTNELTMFFTVVLNIFIFLYLKYYLKQKDLFSLIIIILTVLFSMLTIMAPSNFARHIEYPGEFAPLRLSLLALATSAYDLLTWMINGELILATLIFIYLIKDHLRVPNFSAKAIMTGFIIGVLVFVLGGHLVLILSLKAQSLGERIIDLLYLHFLILWFGCIYLLSGFFSEKIRNFFSMPGSFFLSYSIMIVFILSVFGSGLFINRDNKKYDRFISLAGVHSNVGNAWLTLLNGDAVKYDKQMEDQYRQLKNCQTDTCFVTRPNTLPVQLYNHQSDRRGHSNGEPFMGIYFNRNIKIVRYIQ